ncbi:MAG: sarcosine oxidase subunit delta [Rhodobacteraceae bacterium]|nr:sarcosine oxidase subunit delta [Paracoccaceae bacterium]
MRITCPVCGSRDSREFQYRGDAVALRRPAPDAGVDAWDDYLHLRDNVAGRVRDLWLHGDGCGGWIVVERDTVTHEVFGATLAMEIER